MNKDKVVSDHVTIKLPKELVEEMDRLIGAMGFRSRGEIAKEAIRQLLSHYKESLAPPQLPPLEHFNISEHGVRVLDRTLANGVSKGRIIDVYFKPDKVLCEYCQTDNCRHVEFALSIPKVKKILIEKGWPISSRIKEE
ncbi:MAG: ribbon-helix-helix domain-containing protein [Candidatus Bathyarchaeia archaeon]